MSYVLFIYLGTFNYGFGFDHIKFDSKLKCLGMKATIEEQYEKMNVPKHRTYLKCVEVKELG